MVLCLFLCLHHTVIKKASICCRASISLHSFSGVLSYFLKFHDPLCFHVLLRDSLLICMTYTIGVLFSLALNLQVILESLCFVIVNLLVHENSVSYCFSGDFGGVLHWHFNNFLKYHSWLVAELNLKCRTALVRNQFLYGPLEIRSSKDLKGHAEDV